jgi:hypothetical protein
MDPQTRFVVEKMVVDFVREGGSAVWVSHEKIHLPGKIYEFPKMR